MNFCFCNIIILCQIKHTGLVGVHIILVNICQKRMEMGSSKDQFFLAVLRLPRLPSLKKRYVSGIYVYLLLTFLSG